MPLYEYQCKPHSHRFEVRHGINEEPVQTCPECGGEVRRVIHPVGVVFKGSGFYVTDSRKPQPAASGGESEKKSESKSTEGGKPQSGDQAASSSA